MGAKRFHGDRPDHVIRRWQRPHFAHQLGELDPAPPSPRNLRARRDHISLIKEEFEA
jgi:hypothetical protein